METHGYGVTVPNNFCLLPDWLTSVHIVHLYILIYMYIDIHVNDSLPWKYSSIVGVSVCRPSVQEGKEAKGMKEMFMYSAHNRK